MEGPIPVESELSPTPAKGSQAAGTQCSPAAVESSCNNDRIRHRSLIDVPPELIIIILQASLPIVDPMSFDLKGTCKLYTENLFSLRLVSRTWRDILDDTPSFWVVLTSTVPLSVNHTSITRSGGAPLIVHFGTSPIPAWEYIYGTCAQPDEFTELVGRIRDRWKVLCVDEDAVPTIYDYLTSPALMLETVRLHSHPGSGVPSQGLELFGGETHNIRQLDIHGYIVHWDWCTFRGLKHLKLSFADRYGWTMNVILDILAASPDLEYLCIDSMSFPVSTAPPLYPIYLPHLRTIELIYLPGNVIFSLLRHIEAPHCQRIRIRAENVRISDEWMGESMGSFEPLLREMHEKSGHSQLTVSPSFVDWRTSFKRGSGKHSDLSFEIQLRSSSFISFLQWIERVVDGGDLEVLEMKLYITGENRLPDPEITSILGRLRNVTEIYAYCGPENGREVVRLLCDLDDSLVPLLLSLTVLHIDYEYIAADEILLMLRNRLIAHTNHGGPGKLPHLDIVAELAVEARPEPIKSLDFAIIAQIRATAGVRFILTRLWEAKDRIGMCAIVWDDERGVARWM